MDESLKQMIDTYINIFRKVSVRVEFLEKIEYSLEMKDIRILEYVQEKDECSMNSISKNFAIPASTTTRYIDNLVEMNFLNRKHSTTDRRKIIIFVTEKGAKLLEKRKQAAYERYSQLFSTLDKDDISELHRIMKKMKVPK